MPTYEYSCPDCGNAFEAFQSMKDAPLTKCPKCGGLHVKRLLGAGAGLIFKGSGFYSTDYRSKSSGAPAKESGGSGADGGKSEASKPAETKSTPSPAGGKGPETKSS